MQNPEVKKFLIKSFLFLLPFIIAIAVELFILPVNYFTFRPDEATGSHANFAKILLPGPIYPNLDVYSEEVGEYGAHTKYAIGKATRFTSDQLGYRRQPTAENPADGISSPILLIGDSYTMGIGLSQEDLLSVQLQKLVKEDVYPLGFSGMNYYLSAAYREKERPKIVILEAIEESILQIPLMDGSSATTWLKRKLQTLRFNPIVEKLQPAVVMLDRFFKFVMFRRTKADIDYYLTPKKPIMCNAPETELFGYGPATNLPRPADKIDNFVKGLKMVNSILKQRGIRFIFLPIPQKENIYWECLSEKIKATFLPELIGKLKAAGIETVDIQPVFSKEFAEHHTLLYQPDDDHWSPTGVAITSEILAKMIKNPPPESTH